MRHWLMKSEPGELSIDALAKLPRRTTPWTGVRNYQARNFMRDEMRVGDGVLFYHSSCPEPGIAGIARVAEAARTGRAPREELSGSTITITSLGALGGIASTPVINHPEVAIVGVNRMVERPMLRGGQVVARQLMNLSSSFDHRVVDGMDAARFIQAVRALLETPALLFVE